MGLQDKSWDLQAQIDEQSNVAVDYAVNGDQIVLTVSPIEQLLSAVASCFAISCKVNTDARKLEISSIQVDVHGEKAPDSPSRLGSVAIKIKFTPELGNDTADKVIAGAKRLCTVTNSLSPDVALTVMHQ